MSELLVLPLLREATELHWSERADIDNSSRLSSCNQEALRIKSEANKLFVGSHYPEALQMYTLSLNKNPFDPAVWCNREQFAFETWAREVETIF